MPKEKQDPPVPESEGKKEDQSSSTSEDHASVITNKKPNGEGDHDSTADKKNDLMLIEDPDYDPMKANNVEAGVKYINETLNKFIYKGSTAIGDYVLKYFFSNDITLATSKNPKKPESYNKLCESKELLINAKALSVMVRVASQERYFIKEKINTTGLTYTHKASLIKVYDNDKKKELIEQCIKNKWSTRVLDEEVTKILQHSGEKSLIKLTESYLGRIKTISEFIDKNTLISKKNELNKMTDDKKAKYINKINTLKSMITTQIDKLNELSSQCEDIIK